MRDGLLLIRAVWTGKHDALRDLFPYLRGFTRFPEPLQQPAAGTKAGRRQTYREDLAPLENQRSYSALEARGL